MSKLIDKNSIIHNQVTAVYCLQDHTKLLLANHKYFGASAWTPGYDWFVYNSRFELFRKLVRRGMTCQQIRSLVNTNMRVHHKFNGDYYHG